MTPKLYIRSMGSVEGWLMATSAEAILMVANVQKEAGVKGSSGEIGVHHGKLMILLHLIEPNSFAIDIFEKHDLRQDRSGLGDREKFLNNIKRFGGGDIKVICDSSANVRSEDIPGPVRLFSIDGCHTAALTESDLRLAEQTLTPGGVIILDDYFNPAWPDVSVGANRLLEEGNLIPFAITPNKVFLTNLADHAAVYREALSRHPMNRINTIMCGQEIVFLDDIPRLKQWPLRIALALKNVKILRPFALTARKLLLYK